MVEKTILIISGGKEAIGGIKIAKDMGLKVVVSDYDPNAPGFAYADEKIIASTYDPDETLEKVKQYNGKIDAVVTIACDATRTVAAVADFLKIPGPTLSTAFLATEKLEMKKQFLKDNIPIPWFKEIMSLEDLKSIISERGFPIILKPVDNRGARGVLKLTDKTDLEEAYQHSLKNSFSGKLIVEEWLSGPQYSPESIIWDGEMVTPLISYRNYDKLDEFSPFIIEDGGSMPADLTLEQCRDIDKLMLSAAKSLGLERGIIKGDIVIHNGKPMIIEVAARLSGGNYSTFEIPFCTGVNIVEAAINISLDEKPDFDKLISKNICSLAQRYLFPPIGKIKSITGVDEVKKLEGLELFKIYIEVGDVVGKVSDHSKRGGMIIMSADTKEEAIKRVDSAVNMIKIEVDSND